MRTTITVPDHILKEVLRYSHAEKTTEAINIALSEWLRYRKINEIKKLQGRLEIDDNLDNLKSLELKKMKKLRKKLHE